MQPVAIMPAAEVPDQGLVDACGGTPGWVCEQVYDLTGSEAASRVVDWLVGAPLAALAILVGAAVVRRVTQRAIDRALGRAASLAVRDPRAEARARTISAVLRSTISVVVWVIAALLVLGEFEVNLAPLIAGAGIAGVALGFGAQSLVKDCISGLFMLVEDQYGVGDVVDLGEATGVVEAVSLRVTRLRSVDGTVWHVPNGVITRVGNKSQLWSVAVLDVDVAYGSDLDRAGEAIAAAATEVCARESRAADIVEPPELLGVERLGIDGVTIRLTVKTRPGAQWALLRDLRRAVKEHLEAAQVEIPFPQRTVWVRNAGAGEQQVPPQPPSTDG